MSFCKYLCISAPWTCCCNVLQCWCSSFLTVDAPQQCHSMHTTIRTWISTFHAYLNVCISCVSKQHFILQILIRLKWEFCRWTGQSAFHGYLNVCIPSIPKCQHNVLYFHSTDIIVSDGICFFGRDSDCCPYSMHTSVSTFQTYLNINTWFYGTVLSF